MRTSHQLLLLGLLVLGSAFLTGCGGGDSNSTSITTTTQTAASTNNDLPAPPALDSPYPHKPGQ